MATTVARPLPGISAPGYSLSRLILRLLPYGLAALAAAVMLLAVAGDEARPWQAGVLLLGAILGGGLLRACVLVVEPGQARLLQEWDRQVLRLWLPGYHLYLPFLYGEVGTVRTWPRDAGRTLTHVAFQSGPSLALALTYSGRHLLPPGVPYLPRPHAAYHDRDVLMVRNLYWINSFPEVWDRVFGQTFDRAVRQFFSTLPASAVYDPLGGGVQPLAGVVEALNRYLAATLEATMHYRVGVQTLEVLDGDNAGLLAWGQRLHQLQALLAHDQEWTADQRLIVVSEWLQAMQGSAAPRVGLDPAGWAWSRATGGAPPPTAHDNPPGAPRPLHPRRPVA
jgi:hypothetical protein